MEIVILNRSYAEKIVPNLTIPHIVISITDPTNPKPAEFELNECLKAVLYLKCYDMDFSDGNETHTRAAFTRRYAHGIFTDAQAKQVVNFTLEHKDSIRTIICHCDAGVSRSAGMGAAISLILNGSDKEIFNDKRYVPNMHIYRKIVNEYYIREWGDQ